MEDTPNHAGRLALRFLLLAMSSFVGITQNSVNLSHIVHAFFGSLTSHPSQLGVTFNLLV